MTFKQLTYLLEVSKCGSINKAARNLYISQTAISASMKELEEELGICLFTRNTRGVELTPDGREFLGYAISLLEQNERIKKLYGKREKDAAPEYFTVSTQRYPFTEAAFMSLLKEAPDNNYHFSINETGIDSVIEDVYNHKADIGVISLTELTEKLIGRILEGNGAEFHELATVTPCVFLRANHPLAKKSSVTAAELCGYPFVVFEHSRAAAVDFSEEYQLLWPKRPTRSIGVTNRNSVYNIIMNTDAFTTGSGLLSPGLVDARIISVPIESESAIRIGWIKQKGVKPSYYAERFVEALTISIKEAMRYTGGMHGEK